MSSPPRDFRLADGQKYMLQGGLLESVRLNYQYYIWKENLGFNIHPSVPTSGLRRIADVAAGTGMWTLDVAKDMPHVHLDGFDINVAQAPHQGWLPSNVHFQHWNIFEEPPDDIKGKYDLVHVRLLVLVLPNGEASVPVIQNLWSLLKPGGFLQWDELDVVNIEVTKVNPQVDCPALGELAEKSKAGGRHDWTLRLPEYVESVGFQRVHMSLYGDRQELTRPLNELHLMTMYIFAQNLYKVGKVEAAANFTELVDASYLESSAGAALHFPRLVVVAQKPEK